jgi:hypothetical protein
MKELFYIFFKHYILIMKNHVETLEDGFSS